jgi:hypothetical protein
MTTANNDNKLYSFNWIGGGYNSVNAPDLKTAYKEIERRFSGCSLKVDKTSIKSHKTQAQKDAYYKSLPYWD